MRTSTFPKRLFLVACPFVLCMFPLHSRSLLAERPASETTKESGDSELRSITGRVLNQSGDPVEGARVLLPYLWLDGKYLTVQGRTGADGRFQLEVPARWLKEEVTRLHWVVWVHHEVYALATMQVYQQLRAHPDAKPAEIVLKRPQSITFKVLSNGLPVVGARVVPWQIHTSVSYYHLPDELHKIFERATDATGSVSIGTLDIPELDGVQVVTPGFGTQHFRLPQLNRDRTIELPLAATGRIKGRVIAESNDWLPTVRLYFTSTRHRVSPFVEEEGIAKVEKLNPDGTFEISEIAAGDLRIDSSSAEELPGRLRYPQVLKVAAGETTEITIPFEAGTLVKGAVRMSGKPVAGATVYVRYGNSRQGHQVVTDSEGNYLAYVLPGTCYRQIISIPDSYGRWEQRGVPWSETFEVPRQDEPFAIPPVEILSPKPFEGRLIDQNQKPLTDYHLLAICKGKIFGRATTNEAGEFTIYVPEEEKIEEFKAERKVNVPFRRDNVKLLESGPKLLLQVHVPDEL